MTTSVLPGTAADRAAVASTVVAALATASLLAASVVIGQQHAHSLVRYFLYQAVTLVIAVAIILAIRLITGRRPQYLRVGEMRAGATRVPLLGIKQGESWGRVGTTFAVIVTVVTAVFLVATYGERLGQLAPSAFVRALLLALPLSLTNAFTEEIVTRWSIAEGLAGSARLATSAPWVSAVVFGTVHYFGIPGGPTGALMAGFLAWLATRSILDTRGIGWAWLLHFVQDVLIFTVTLSLFV